MASASAPWSALLLLGSARGECPAAAWSSKFQVTQATWAFADRYDITTRTQGDEKVLATASDNWGFPKVMTLYSPSGDVWASAKEDFYTGELSFYDCAGELICSLKKPSSGTVMQDGQQNNVAEVRSEYQAFTWAQTRKVTLMEEPAIAGESGKTLVTLFQEKPGLAYKTSVEISALSEETEVAGRRARRLSTSGDNPALNPVVLALYSALGLGGAHFFVGGKFLDFLVLVVCTCLCLCCLIKKRLANRRFDGRFDDSLWNDDDYDSDTERFESRSFACLCCRGVPSPSRNYKTMPTQAKPLVSPRMSFAAILSSDGA